MKVIGIDIGTTSVSSVVMDAGTGEQIIARTLPNDTAVAGEKWAKEQDPVRIWEKCSTLIKEYEKSWTDISAIGITGQMHGILYLDENGNALSPLFTWEDERGNLIFRDQKTYVQVLQESTGYPMATGYGLTTHYYNLLNDLVPSNAVCIATIMDYVAIRLTGSHRPVMHASNAASLGLFDLRKGTFDKAACLAAGIDVSILPEVSGTEEVVGTTQTGIKVIIPIGDNQAGILGLIKDPGDVVVNIGTSSQISIVADNLNCCEGLECRPYVGGKYLYLGAGLCGGTSFRLLNDFFCETCRLFSEQTDRDKMFEMMRKAAEEEAGNEDRLTVRTQFRGTREDPNIRGSITGIDMSNFTPGSLVLGFYRGVCTELYEAYEKMNADPRQGRLLLCGNAFRNNALLRSICGKIFGREVVLTDQKEETAVGAAFLAAQLLRESIRMTVAGFYSLHVL